MRLDERAVRLAAALVAPSMREVRRQEWLVDLARADEAGLSRRDVAVGALIAGVIGLTMRPLRRRTVVIGAVGVVLVGILVVPVVVVGGYLLDQARGVVTVERAADGAEVEVQWRDYPGIADIDPAEVLAAPRVAAAEAEAARMIGEMRDALSAEFPLVWAPVLDLPADETRFRAQNGYGGYSQLVTVNAPESTATGVPATGADKRRAIAIIAEVASRYGYGAPVLDSDRGGQTDADRVETYGGTRIDDQVLVSGMLLGPAGQWLGFGLTDPAHDTDGTIAQRVGEDGRLAASVEIFYGANALLPEGRDAAFVRALADFDGYARPAPQED